MRKIVRFTEKDNVAVVLYDVCTGDQLNAGSVKVEATENIPYGHKVALQDIEVGDIIVKYGEPVAKCTQKVTTGNWVHVHNCESIRGIGRK